MIKIRILKDTVQVLKGVGKDSGKPYELHIQTAYAYTVDESGEVTEIPEKFEFILHRDASGEIVPPLARGDYTISPAAFYVDRQGRLSLNPRFQRTTPAREGVKA